MSERKALGKGLEELMKENTLDQIKGLCLEGHESSYDIHFLRLKMLEFLLSQYENHQNHH